MRNITASLDIGILKLFGIWRSGFGISAPGLLFFRRVALTSLIALSVIAVVPAGVAAGHLEPFTAVPVPEKNPQTPEKVELGKKLFFDRRLSGDGTTNCGTCHDPEKGWGDGLAISLSYPTTRNWRNAQPLYNVGYQTFLFHDGRVRTLEDQALFPLMSAYEMNQNLDFLEEEIRSVPEYVEAFTKVFGDADVTRERIAMAIAAFERTIVTKNAPLDRHLKGDKQALSAEAKKGLAIFEGKGRCTECHDGPALSDNKFYALNVPENAEQEKDPRVAATRRFVAKVYHFPDYRTLAEDPGRYLITYDKKDWKAFRTPMLWEIARTGPYMHNGSLKGLDEVIDFFDQGGGKGNAVLKPLRLTATEKKQLKTFLTEALSGQDEPFTYPKVP